MSPVRYLARSGLAGVVLLIAALLPSVAPAASAPAFVLGVSADGESCLLGGAIRGRITGPKALAPLMRHGDLYQLLNLDKKVGIAPAIGIPRDESGEGGDCSGLWLQNLALDPLRKKKSAIAIRLKPGEKFSGLPPLKRLNRNAPEYTKLLHAFLVGKGIKKPVVRITQVIGADFDGDGTQDALINAVRTRRDRARRGDYSVVLLKLNRPDRPAPLVIQEEITKTTSRFPGNLWVNVIIAVIDLDGDKKPEIVMEGQSHFGGGWELIRLVDGKIKHGLFCGCEG
ncbi:MAG TPA: hypothetical protein ENJ57_08565 [Rhizobiales bacterium]|nr:hypothetical protein [Hyphomicrobiales bacterium]